SNLQFVSAEPASIAIRGTGGVGLSEVSRVRFRLVDQANNPVTTPTDVTLALSTGTGGLLIDQSPGPVVRQTDANGEVEVQVQAGVLPTPVWVIASLEVGGRTMTTNSTVLTVSTDQPIQSRFSLSFEKLNIEGLEYDNEQSVVTILAADNFGNPVADGTAVNFISEGASIGDACATVNGECTVVFRSQENRPVAAPGRPRSDTGRVSVLAFAVGEEAYDDYNSNNAYDPGETFYDLGYVYVDADEDGRYDEGERFIGFNDQGAACVNPSASSFGVPGIPDTCDGHLGQAHVRRQGVMVLSGSFAFFKSGPIDPQVGVPPSNIRTVYQFGAACLIQVPFWLQDVNGNPMPVDTTLGADVTAGKDLAASVAGEVVPNTNARGGTFHVLNVSGLNPDSNECTGSGTVVINVRTPKGNLTSLTIAALPQP
ncbi:MAG: hypothetical protein JSW68_07505, partial [Burkholderiales bacterium]